MTRYVTRYVVTGVRRERARDGSHTHVSGVYAGETYFPRQQVLRSLDLMNDWVAAAGAGRVTPLTAGECPHPNCDDTDILTAPDAAADDGLDALPDC